MADTLEKNKSNIIVYTAPGCVYCHNLKSYLKEQNVIFDEIDVTKNMSVADDIIKKTGQLAVPVVEINNEIIIGFDKEKLRGLLKIKK